ncbi:CLUMA_CG015682, isoform A [Clunio marinus]|uniref:CLUMA_CG015682, isoform A n=1 Tax=Clunio marinus TaxID=568069 RepID=A0A1J1IQD0_9DIPT|nr:CLUMA_CG015682, isoform A [Clunio marinus]
MDILLSSETGVCFCCKYHCEQFIYVTYKGCEIIHIKGITNARNFFFTFHGRVVTTSSNDHDRGLNKLA